MEQKSKSFVTKHNLINFKLPLIVAISGGADSVALLHLLHSWHIPIIALHCNFNLRNDESNRDEQFVQSICQSWQIDLEIKEFDTLNYAQQKGISIEMAARELRYDWFEQRRLAHNAQAIAVAHHQNDREETILINLLRGTGIRGLVALRPKQGAIIRPLLSINQLEIHQYCQHNKLQFVDDSTNFLPVCTRNRIRLELLPLMESIAPGAGKRLIRLADQLELPKQLLETHIETFCATHQKNNDRYSTIEINAIIEHPYGKDILFEITRPFAFKNADLDDIIRSFTTPETKQFFSTTHRIIKERDLLYITPRTPVDTSIYSIDQDNTLSPFNSLNISTKKNYIKGLISLDVDIQKTLILDYDKLNFPLQLRHPIIGDRIHPINMKGTKLVSDYLKELKIPLIERENIWLLLSNKQVVAIVGYRADDRFKVTDSTHQTMQIDYSLPQNAR